MSALASLLVPVDRDRPAEADFASAGILACAFHAHVIGAMACEHQAEPYFVAGAVGYDPIEEDRKRLRGIMAEHEGRFRAALSACKAPSFEWRCAIAWAADHVAAQSRGADLIVMQRGVPDGTRDLHPGDVLMTSGRPLLLTGRSPLKLDAPALVAWKDTRETRRAVADALPLLAKASAVRVCEILHEGDTTLAAEERIADVIAWLKRHGIQATGNAFLGVENAEFLIEELAGTMKAGLVVAGGYGHSRLGEWVFGGVTRHLIHQSERTVLLSR